MLDVAEMQMKGFKGTAHSVRMLRVSKRNITVEKLRHMYLSSDKFFYNLKSDWP